jgi:hypothetical protein
MLNLFGVLIFFVLMAACGGSVRDKQIAVKDGPVSTKAQGQASPSRKEPGYGVRGTVITPDGLPIVGVVVLAESIQDSRRQIPQIEVVTGRDGSYWWPLREGRYRLSIAVEGFPTVTHEVEVRPNAVERLDFTLRSTQR